MPLLQPALLVSLLALSGAARAQDGIESGLATIHASEVEEAIRYLSSSELEGRDSPSRGLDLALAYTVRRFTAAGLVPAPDSRAAWDAVRGSAAPPDWALAPNGGVWLRPYRAFALGRDTELERPDPERSGLDLELEEGRRSFTFGEDFMPIGGCPGDVRGELVFAGYGIQSKRERYDDLKGLRLAGKVVLVLEGEPRHARRFQGEETTADASLWSKLERLDEDGVAAVLVVRRPSEGSEAAPLSFRTTWASWIGEPNERRPVRLPPAMEVSLACASELLGSDVDEIARRIDRSAKPVREKLDGRRVSLRAVTERGAVDLANVVGVLPGGDLAEEAIVVGAHADHIGVGPRGRIAHGADDNASGLAALIEVAEALSGTPSRRSVYCVAFSAEEDGLVGSREFCAAPPIPAERMAAMINLDMVGRGEEREVVVLGATQNPGIENVLERARRADRAGMRRIEHCRDAGLFQRSDHFSFHQVGVPVIFFLENYPLEKNQDYHTWRDVAEQVDMDKVTNTARIAFTTAWILANDDDRLPPPRD